MALSRRTQRFEQVVKLLSIGLLAVLLLSVGSLYLPFTYMQNAQQQMEQRQQQLQQARQAPQQLRQLQEQLTQAERELRFLEAGVSQSAYIPTMLRQIEQLAQQHQLKIVAIRPQQNNQNSSTTQTQQGATNQQANSQQAQPRKAYEEQMIEINLQGKFWSLMSFLRQLDEFPKILAVQTLNTQAKLKPEQENTNPDLDIRITVKAFIFPQGTASVGTSGQATQQPGTTQ